MGVLWFGWKFEVFQVSGFGHRIRGLRESGLEDVSVGVVVAEKFPISSRFRV